ncbi:MAG: tetratricopeptide repeat protein [Promethearchaeota archaeon]
MKNCPYCNEIVRETDKYCYNCKKPLLTFISQKEDTFYRSLQPYNYLHYEEEEEEFDISSMEDDNIDQRIKKINDTLEKKQASGEPIGDLLLKKASLYHQKRDLMTSSKIIELALTSFGSEGDMMNVAVCHNELGLIQEDLGIFDEAIYQFDTALEILKDIGDSQKIIKLYNNIANIYQLTKDFEHSYDYYKKAIDLARKENMIMEEVKSSSNLVDVLFSLNNYEPIEKILDRNAFIFNQTGDVNGTIITLMKYGKLNYHLGVDYFNKSLKRLNDSLELINKIGDRISIYAKSQMEWECYYYIGKIYFETEKYTQSENNVLRSLEALRTFEIEDSINQAQVLETLGLIYKAQEKHEKAIEYLDLSATIYDRFGILYSKARIKSLVARIILDGSMNYSKAIKYNEEALDIYEKEGYEKETADILHELGDIYIKINLEETSLDYFERAKLVYIGLQDDYNTQLVREKIDSLRFS